MKLKTLAIAITAAAMPFAAQAELKVSGDVGVAYEDIGGTKAFGPKGSNVTLHASETVGGTTYYGNADFDFGTGNSVAGDDIYVGMKGGFGEVVLGDTDNGCDATDAGATNEVWLTHSQGGCAGSDRYNVTYKRSLGKFSVAASVKPTDTTAPAAGTTPQANGAENFAVGIKGGMGPVTASLGYESMKAIDAVVATGVTAVAKTNNTVLGLSGKVGPFTVGFAANKAKGSSAAHGVNFMYSKNGHNFYGGAQTKNAAGGNKDKSLGYKRVLGNTDFIIEMEDTGAATNGTSWIMGMRHRF